MISSDLSDDELPIDCNSPLNVRLRMIVIDATVDFKNRLLSSYPPTSPAPCVGKDSNEAGLLI